MLTNIIFILIALILLFVLYLAVKAITRGVEAKNDLNSNNETNETNEDSSTNLSNEIIKIKKLHDDGVLNDEEYKKAKDKILKNNYIYSIYYKGKIRENRINREFDSEISDVKLKLLILFKFVINNN